MEDEDTPLLHWFYQRLGDPGRIARLEAQALGDTGAAAATPEVLARLTDRLGDGDWPVRRAAAQALGDIGAAAATPEVLARLAELLRDPELCVRMWAAAALGRFMAQGLRIFKASGPRWEGRPVEELGG